MRIKWRPTLLIISSGLVAALILSIVKEAYDIVSVIAIALTGTLKEMVKSEEASNGT